MTEDSLHMAVQGHDRSILDCAAFLSLMLRLGTAVSFSLLLRLD